MTNSEAPDQLASEEATVQDLNCLQIYAGHIWVQIVYQIMFLKW